MTMITLTCDPLGLDGSPARGYIDLWPATASATTFFLPMQKITVAFDGETDEVDVDLLASDDPALLTTPLQIWVQERLENVSMQGNGGLPYAITLLLDAGSPQRLSVLRANVLTPPPAGDTPYTPLTTFNAHATQTIAEGAHGGAAGLASGDLVDGYVPLVLDGELVYSPVPAGTPSDDTPEANAGAGDPGTDVEYSRGDHVHPAGGGGMANPMTQANDLIVGGASGTPTRLGVGSSGQAFMNPRSGGTIGYYGFSQLTANNPLNGSNTDAQSVLNAIYAAVLASCAIYMDTTTDTDIDIISAITQTLNTAAALVSGTGTLAYSKALAATPTVFNSTALPVSLVRGDILRVSFTGVSGKKCLTLERTA